VKTEDLIANLSADVPRVPRHALGMRLAWGVAAGCIGAALLVAMFLGISPDLENAMHGFEFWTKWVYSLTLGAAALVVASRLARPTPGSLRVVWFVAVPVLVLAGIGIGELARTPSTEWLAMWLGSSWSVCPFNVLGLSLPIFAGLLWSFRRLAPTRLRAAGAAAGLAAGAWAATIYCLHCPEASAIFVLTWYSLGILLATGVGALVGPRFLRW
jgi:hypothetical protein